MFNLRVNLWPLVFINKPNLKTYELTHMDEAVKANLTSAIVILGVIEPFIPVAQGCMTRSTLMASIPALVVLPCTFSSYLDCFKFLR